MLAELNNLVIIIKYLIKLNWMI